MDSPPTGSEVITCPKCGHAFEPTALLRAKLAEQIKAQVESAYASRLGDAIERAEKSADERLQTQSAQLKQAEEELTQARTRLGEAAQKEAELLRRDRELSDRERQSTLDLERKLAEATAQIRAQADKEARERAELATAEVVRRKDEELAAAQKRLGEATRKEAELLRREREVADREVQASLDVEKRLAEEIARIRPQADKDARERAELATAEVVRIKDEELVAVQKRLGEATLKEAELLRREREMQDRERQIPVELERRLTTEASKVREQLTHDAQEAQRLREEEHRQQITGLQTTIEELTRRAAQGSQQIQGEAQEVVLKDLLSRAFPRDDVEDVAKGTPGADLQQRVRDEAGTDCGTILWESKRTKSWSDEWLPKLRDDMRAAGAACAAIVSRSMPAEIPHFGQRAGIWICSWDVVVPVAAVLRAGLVEVAVTRRNAEGRGEKIHLLYNYLTSPEFKNRVGGVVEAFTDMRRDLEDEMKKMRVLWSKRAKQLDRAHENIAAFYGSLRGIAGRRIGEIEALEFSGPELLGPPAAAESDEADTAESAPRPEDPELAELLFELIPADGETVGNKSLVDRFVDEAVLRLKIPVAEEDYTRCKEMLLSQGRIRRGGGRGGSVSRTPEPEPGASAPS